MALQCYISHPWLGDDFTACFRETVINGLIPLALQAISIVHFGKLIWQQQLRSSARSSAQYMPLLRSASKHSNYGSSRSDLEQAGCSTSNSSIITEQIRLAPLPCWSLYNVTRIVASAIQFGICCFALWHIWHHSYPLDIPVEGVAWSPVIAQYAIFACLWGYTTLISVVVAKYSPDEATRNMSDKLCQDILIIYVCHLFISLVNARSFYLAHDWTVFPLGYRLAIASFGVTIHFLCIEIHEERKRPAETRATDTGRLMSGEIWASIYSKFMFSWISPMMKEGYRRTLEPEDLLELAREDRAKNTLADYNSKKTQRSMALSVFVTLRGLFLHQLVYSIVWSFSMFVPPYALNKIVKYIENPELVDQDSVSTAFLYVLALFIALTVQSLSYQQSLHLGRIMGIRIQSIVIGEVYAKALRCKEQYEAASVAAVGKEKDQQSATSSNVNNLLSVDAQKLGEVTAYLFYLYCFPLQIAVSVIALYRLLGTAAFYGVLVMICSQPVTYLVSTRFQKLHREAMSCTDKRIKLMNEMLGAIRIVKFFAWEKEFRTRILQARAIELKAIRGRLYMLIAITSTWFMIPTFTIVAVFYIYTRTNELTASVAFTALALFNTCKSAVDDLPFITSAVLQAKVSLKRVENFLQEDEVEQDHHHQMAQQSALLQRDPLMIGFTGNASFAWSKSAANKPVLSNLNLSFPRNKLSIVCGPTGSGKTTLLASLLGETYCLSGSATLPRHMMPTTGGGGAPSGIAYVAQTVWLRNCSIRDNILFGLPYDQERYEKVLFMTALTRDLEILELGDSTEVGEKGVTLSGGQKQRLAIARAVYSQADIVLLDDCLSAVDAHTAKHLYEHCIRGEYMKGRTVILVTHYVGLCLQSADYVVVLKDGQVAAAGSPEEVVQTGVLGEDIVVVDDEEKDGESIAVSKVPTVVKPAAAQENAKLVQEEKRAEGSVSWDVYRTYIQASGGYLFWVAVAATFCLTQGSILAQDYWIKVWADGGKGSNQYYLGMYILIGFVALALTTLRLLVLFSGSLLASRRLHERLLERVLHARVRFFDVTPLGRIINRFSSDLETVDQALAPSLSGLLYSFIAASCVVLLIVSVIPAFLIPGFVIAMLFWAVGSYYLSTSRDLKRLNSVSRSPIYVQFHETVSGVTTIRAFGCQKRFMEENYVKIDNNNRSFIWMWATNRWLHCRVDILGAFVGFCTGFVLLLYRSSIAPGLAGLALSYSLTFTRYILWTVRQYAMYEMNCNSVERIQEYLDVEQEPHAHIPATCPRPSWPETGSLRVENLVMQYAPENPPVLRGISFETRPYEKIGIVGRTGSGKSTLALSLFRFMEATSGKIVLDGVDISEIGLEDLRSRLTIIPQDPVLFSGTLRSNLDPFGQYSDADMYAALKRAHLIGQEDNENGNDDGKMITLGSPVAENGSNWSQGQRQLIALARALVKKTSLVVLDEATSSVDFDTDHKIQQTIRNEFSNSSLLCIAHRIRTVIDYDRILVLDHGKIVEFDTPYALLNRQQGIFRQMCERTGEFDELYELARSKQQRSTIVDL